MTQQAATKTALTKEEVEQAVDQLILSNTRVSVRSIRKELGDYGSFGDIAGFLKLIREERAALSSAVYSKVPGELADAFVEFWQKAKGAASEEYQQSEEKLSGEIDELTGLLEEKRREITELEASKHTLVREADDLAREFADFRKAAEKEAARLDKLQLVINDKDEALASINAKLLQTKDAHKAEIEEAREQFKREESISREVITKMQARLDDMADKNETMADELVVTESSLRTAKDLAAQRAIDLAAFKSKLESERVLSAARLESAEKAEQQLAATEAKLQVAEGRLEESQKEALIHAQTQTKNAELNAEIAAITRSHEQLQEQVVALTKANEQQTKDREPKASTKKNKGI